jgi:hypothetical protein
MTQKVENQKNLIPTPIMNQLVVEFGVTKRYIREAISKNRQSILCEKIEKRYRELNHAVEKAIQTA